MRDYVPNKRGFSCPRSNGSNCQTAGHSSEPLVIGSGRNTSAAILTKLKRQHIALIVKSSYQFPSQTEIEYWMESAGARTKTGQCPAKPSVLR